MFLGISFRDAKLKPFDYTSQYSEFDAICSIEYMHISWDLKKNLHFSISFVWCDFFFHPPSQVQSPWVQNVQISPRTWIIVHSQATALDHSRGTAPCFVRFLRGGGVQGEVVKLGTLKIREDWGTLGNNRKDRGITTPPFKNPINVGVKRLNETFDVFFSTEAWMLIVFSVQYIRPY